MEVTQEAAAMQEDIPPKADIPLKGVIRFVQSRSAPTLNMDMEVVIPSMEAAILNTAAIRITIAALHTGHPRLQ